MGRLERLKEYANPRRRENWDGETCDKANLDRWSERAAENSKLAPRARGGAMKLADTDKMDLHSTSDAPRRDKDADKRAVAKADTNTDGGSSFMRSVRRQA
ncbi:hypothetical protein AB7645_05490 [Bradyrhizobium sp. 956_D2_N1_5]|uniref:hypothetical protein n=1 Tax=unclassified Bradyrhizobium TaxID=2631580 RepID=UPI003F24279A